MQYNNLSAKKRMTVVLLAFLLFFIVVIIRLGYLQFVKSEELQAKAESQQSSTRQVGARRGTIYDCSGERVLAISSTVYTVTVNPMKIPNEKKEILARKLSELFELDYEKVLKKVTKKSSIETIIKRQEKEKTDGLRTWMEENDIYIGINIDEDTKRYYPFSNLASHIIGFCGSDNQGLEGIEAKYEDILAGKSGKINSLTDAKGQSFGDEGEKYIEAKDGNDLVLTIDSNIQAIIQKYLEEACIDNVCTDGGSIIAMNPQNGDIWALANYPNYDLNSPYESNDENIKNIWGELEQAQKTNYLMSMWRNKAIADTYEPRLYF